MNYHKCILIIIVYLFSNIALCGFDKRIREKTATEEINTYFLVNFNGMYEVSDIVDIDSVRGDLRYFFETIQNPYGMLTNSFVFVTQKSSDYQGEIEGNKVGVFKEGEIVWLSNPLLPQDMYGAIWAIDDINLDGTVEIITKFGSGDINLWIISWDGKNNGVLLNDEEIYGGEFATDLVDVEGDGIMEIRDLRTEGGNNVYSWNGQKYGHWTNTPSAPENILFPANNFIPIITCKVIQNGNIYTYCYTVKNDGTSKQRIDLIWIVAEVDKDDLQKTIPSNWASSGYADNFEGWSSPVLNNGYQIWPGDTQNGFRFITHGLPTITNSSMQAANAIPLSDDDFELYYKDRKENMVVGKTIGPKSPLSNFNPREFLDSLISFINNSFEFTWIADESTYSKYNGWLVNAQEKLQQQDTVSARSYLQDILHEVDIDSSSTLTSEAYALLRYNTEYLLEQIPEPQPTEPIVKLANSTGSPLTGGVCQYYEGGWQTATDNGDGTFSIETDKASLSIRMTYAYGTQTLSNVAWGTGPVVFQTVNTQVQLKDSKDTLIDEGTVKYYAGGWRDFGATENGIASKELLPINYSFRMTYAYASNDKQQDLSADPIVVFHTVPVTVRLQNSEGNLIDEGAVKYYAGGWREFGITTNGEVTKELLPNNYSFRMTYAYASNDKQQNIGNDSTVIFQTVPAIVQLKDSRGNFIDEGSVKYYAGGWRNFGSTSDGVAIKELLPNNYSFRMTYGYAGNDKQQNLNDNTTIVFQTVNASVQLKNSSDEFIDVGTVQYYSGGWRNFGTTTNGIATLELLPNNYSFRMTYAFANNDKQQNIGTDPTVIFQTVPTTVQLKNSTGDFIDQGAVQYYSGGWRNFGTTTNGVATLELLPNNYSFRMTYAFASNDKQQNIGDNPTIIFQTVPATIQLKDSKGNLIDEGTVKYYAGGWRTFGTTTDGIATLELLPNNYSFRMTHEFISNDKAQNINENNVVEFSTVNSIVHVKDQLANPLDGAAISYYSGGWRQIGTTVNGEITKELLPKNLTFRAVYDGSSQDKTQDTTIDNLVEFTITE